MFKNRAGSGRLSATERSLPWARGARRVLLLALALLLLSAAPAAAQATADGVQVVPDTFLRRWDPVTFFFAAPVGPAAANAPEDRPGRFVSIEPAHPGAFVWLDARTLQFRPADAWPALRRFTFKAGGRSFNLSTLMAPPIATIPAAGAAGLGEVEAITLTFAEPLAEAALAKAATLELRPLPGLGLGRGRVLDQRDFTVKALERSRPADPASYVLTLREPLPLGHRVLVSLALAEGPLAKIDAGHQTVLEFTTAEPFRVATLGCLGGQYPVTPDGSVYTAEQAITCDGREAVIRLDFTAEPKAFGPVELRDLLRIDPHVGNLAVTRQGKQVEVRGDFARDTTYHLTLVPAPLEDVRGRRLEIEAASEIYLHFPTKAAFLRFTRGHGLVERYGPQRVPIEGRGDTQADLRIFKVDPLDRRVWPFPDQPVVEPEGNRPPGPGEEIAPFNSAEGTTNPAQILAAIRAKGSPPVSTLVELPLSRRAAGAQFGLDLRQHLAKLAGADAPGTYLVGLRRLAGKEERSWMRVQVTDLSLTTADHGNGVTFVVTSLKSAAPVAGATIQLEGTSGSGDGRTFGVLASGTTDGEGRFLWQAPGYEPGRAATLKRIVVRKGDDVLAMGPEQLDTYHDGNWSPSYSPWLQWAFQSLEGRGPQPRWLGHIFPERPVYRPEDKVHLKGYLREKREGRLAPWQPSGAVVVDGPGERRWRLPVEVDEFGSFYAAFEEEDLPSGTYSAFFEEDGTQQGYGRTTFRKEAYKLPKFDVLLTGPTTADATLDREFKVQLTATYYAGGRVAQRPIAWRVTQYPYAFQPRDRPGFLFSSDGRFSRTERFRSTPTLEKEELTDDDGGNTLWLNPAIEPTAQPRTYVVEATVTDVDDATVTSTQRINVLPPFVLGMKAPRFLESGQQLTPEILVVGPDDVPVAGQELTVRLHRRAWHSHLQASDFTDGVARYVTDVVDEKISEQVVRSTAAPLALPLQLPGAGVYVIEVEGRDRLGRAQVLAIDLFAAGDEKVTWPKPTAALFEVSADQKSYTPGDLAKLVLHSPFQQAHALAVVEAQDGIRYSWIDIRGGQGVFELEVEDHFTPRLPVHFLLYRGRLAGALPQPGNNVDLGKPATLAATEWIEVEPLAHKMTVGLDYPKQARPGQKIDIDLTLAAPDGSPLSGQVTLWLVDQAVLALGKEQRLDPLPDFVVPEPSLMDFQDTRAMVFGLLPFAEIPGGDGGVEDGLFNRQTVRRNFVPVPYYEPDLRVGPDGKLRVAVTLPDSLTNFEIRAKAVSLPERFGVAKGHLEVRLPVIVQPSLPRFVRPGDEFEATAIGRLVTGEGGPATAEAQVEGVEMSGAARREMVLAPDRPERLAFQVSVPEGGEGEATFRVAIERTADRVGDAFEVKLPIRDDRRPVVQRQLVDLPAGQTWTWPALTEQARPGTVERQLFVADRPEVVRMAAGLDALLEYPFGCTEQRLSRARALIAMEKFRAALGLEQAEDPAGRIDETIDWIQQVTLPSGLCSYWPGSEGYVSLTAWSLQFLVEAKAAGHEVSPALQAKLERALSQSLRSDSSQLIDGAEWSERTMALQALADAGRFDGAYGAELARRTQFLDAEDVARVLLAWQKSGQPAAPREALLERLWQGVEFKLYQGQEVFAGLRSPGPQSPLILPSETRALATMVEALAADRGAPRYQALVDALVRLGRGDGWGSTQANAAALGALAEVLVPDAKAPASKVEVKWPEGGQTLSFRGGAEAKGQSAGAVPVAVAAGGPALVARAESRWVPARSGAEEPSVRQGFVVERELLFFGASGEPPRRLPLEAPQAVSMKVGQVIEDHVRLVSSGQRHFVALVVPLAAGMEPLNPRLATAPPEAKTAGKITLEPTYADYRDDYVAFYYNELPAGTYDFYFRTRATTPGTFVQPPARAELMYDAAVWGQSPGARVTVEQQP
jgi:uncharacterized protein YfaS (alpha-2-macroglobulin family)